ncbi:hypothetical protein FRAHR75_590011 [Frankia sp. Hr75.2]|nr:hypothetical protein FRAHR75_590011 [Frankia sp. Hr75.2]
MAGTSPRRVSMTGLPQKPDDKSFRSVDAAGVSPSRASGLDRPAGSRHPLLIELPTIVSAGMMEIKPREVGGKRDGRLLPGL